MRAADPTPLEDWQVDFEWLRVRHYCQDRFSRASLPDIKSILFLLGLQELGHWPASLSKEQKQDVIHVGTCAALAMMGFYTFDGLDDDGWPHYRLDRLVDESAMSEQEELLKRGVIAYFSEKIYDDEEAE